MSTLLSVNLNKIALLRNSRGRDFPNLLDFAKRTLELGVKGLTVHPRPDERHIRRQDVKDLATLVKDYPQVELNVEGSPSPAFIDLIHETKPTQVTLVPDTEQQLTSDHGWNLKDNLEPLIVACRQLRKSAGRVAVFVDPGAEVARLGGVCDRIELYTEHYAQGYEAGNDPLLIIQLYQKTAAQAIHAGLKVNAGHDLDLQNLAQFLKINHIDEVSIGHALTVEALAMGWEAVINKYLKICNQAQRPLKL